MLVAIIGSFPISLASMDDNNECNLNENYKYHLIYLVLVGIALMTNDIYSIGVNAVLQRKKQNHSQILVSPTTPFDADGNHGCLCESILIFINVFASAAYIYEYYSDLLIIWIAAFDNNNAVFGFFAVIFPLVNRVMQLIVLAKLFIFGMKQFKKTVSNDRIDKHLMLLNLFNVSKQLYPKMKY